MRPLSARMLEVLEALAAAPDSVLPVAALVAEQVRAGTAPASAQSSTSRTLARLRRRRLVELLGAWDGARFRRARRVRLTELGRGVGGQQTRGRSC